MYKWFSTLQIQIVVILFVTRVTGYYFYYFTVYQKQLSIWLFKVFLQSNCHL